MASTNPEFRIPESTYHRKRNKTPGLTREKILKDVKAFEASGGKIYYAKQGESGRPPIELSKKQKLKIRTIR